MTRLSCTCLVPVQPGGLCAIVEAYSLLERALRAKARNHGNTLQAAQFGDLAIRAMRRRFRHVDGCSQCLRTELEAE
jgi:hypothetical protein